MNTSNISKHPILLTGAASLLITLSLIPTGFAAPLPADITWGPAMNITPSAVETDVLNTGILVGAFNLGAAGVSSTTVNGVTFAPFAVSGTSTTVGDYVLNSSGMVYSTNTAFGSAATPFASLSTPYKTLLESGTAVFGTEFYLNLNNLTVGQDYTFQWCSNDSGPQIAPYATTATSVNTVALNDNTSGYVAGGLGQYATGTFTAISNVQVIEFSGAAATPLFNAFQLRTVPEPASAILLFGAGAMLALRRRRASV